MAVSTGSFTVGSGPTDTYPTWGGAAGAVTDIAGTLTGPLTFTGTTSTTEAAVAEKTLNCGEYLLTLNGNSGHKGDPTAGLINTITASHNGIYFIGCQSTGDGGIVVTDFNMISSIGGGGGRLVSCHQVVGKDITSKYSDLLLNGGGEQQWPFYAYTPSTGSDFELTNVNAWGAATDNFIFSWCGHPLVAENCNAYAAARRGVWFEVPVAAATLNNFTSCDNVGDDFNGNGGAGISANNCSSSDATASNSSWGVGTGNLSGVNTSACVKSVDDSSSDFFVILSAGPWASTGITNTIDRPTDIRNVKVPGESGTSIGVSEILTDYPSNFKFNSTTIDCNGLNANTNYRLTTTVDSDDATINDGGDFDLGLDVTWNTSALEYITFDGSISATPTLNSNTIGNVVVNKSGGATVTLQDTFTCYALTAISGDFDQNGQTITTSGDQIYTGGGTLTLDTSSTILQDADYIIGSGWSTLDIASAEVDLRGTGDIKSNTSDITFGKLKLANTGKVTTNNGTSGIGCNGLVLSGTLVNNDTMIINIDSNTDLTLGSGHIISGTDPFIIQPTSAMSLTVSGINVIAPLHISTDIDTSGSTVTLNGDLTTSGDFYLYRHDDVGTVISINGDLNISGDFYVGN